jgi:hypothetical protein
MPIATALNENNRTIWGREKDVFSDHRSKYVCRMSYVFFIEYNHRMKEQIWEIRKLLSALSDYNINPTELTLSNETHLATSREFEKLWKE